MLRRYELTIAIVLFAALPSWSFEQRSHHGHKMWYMGRVLSVVEGEFAFRTRWYPSRTVHVNESTTVKCAGRVFPITAMHPGDIVDISALADETGINGTKIKVHLSRKTCDARTTSDPSRDAIP